MYEAIRCAAHRCGPALLLIVAGTAFQTANAAEPYVDVGVVGSELKITGFTEPVNNRLPGSSGTERSAGWRIAGGYRFSRYVAVEAGFADFGNKTPDDILIETGTSHTTYLHDTRIKIKGPYAALVGSVPADHWLPFAKIGVLRADTSVSTHIITAIHFSPQVIDTPRSVSAKTAELQWGVGVAYRFTDRYGAALELMSVPKVGDKDRTGEDDLTALSLSFQYTF
jgi:hypothetical protein